MQSVTKILGAKIWLDRLNDLVMAMAGQTLSHAPPPPPPPKYRISEMEFLDNFVHFADFKRRRI
jgi:hypothetical protein